jgi:hypothetical protein
MRKFKAFKMNKSLYMVLAIVVGALLFVFGGHDAHASGSATLATAGVGAVVLTSEEKEGLDEASQKTLLAIKKSLNQSVQDFRQGLMTKEDVQNQFKTFKDGLNETELKALKEMIEGEAETSIKSILTKQGNMINEIRQKGNQTHETLFSIIEANKDAIKISATTKGKTFDFEIKADTLRASVVGNPSALDLPEIGQLATRKLTVYDIFRKVPVPKDRNGVIRYVDWDADTTVRAAKAVAEGADFDPSTARWATYTLSLEKIGDMIPMSEEFLYDASTFAAELENFLKVNVAIKVDTDLIAADGASPNIKGLLAYTPAYAAAASGIVDASLYDLIVKVREAITKPYGSKYSPDTSLMNITDINRMKLKKDQNNNYVMPPFKDANGNVIDGVTVIECNAITANTMVVGDSRYGAIYEEPGIAVTTGLDTGDFKSDMVTVKARRRMNLLIRTVDRTGWLKVTDIDAALLTLAQA